MTAKQILPLVLAAHRALVDDLDAQLDISAKGLSDMLAASARAHPKRFMKLDKPVRYRVVPIGSYLEVESKSLRVDRSSIVRDREDRKRKQEEADLAATLDSTTKRAVYGPAERSMLAATERPPLPQTATDQLNLEAKTERDFGAKKVKEVLAQELEARGLPVTRSARDRKPTASWADLCAELKTYHRGATIVPRMVVDHEPGPGGAKPV